MLGQNHFPELNQHILTFLHPISLCKQGHILTTPWDALRGGGLVCHRWYGPCLVPQRIQLQTYWWVDESFVVSSIIEVGFQILSIDCLSKKNLCSKKKKVFHTLCEEELINWASCCILYMYDVCSTLFVKWADLFTHITYLFAFFHVIIKPNN
jgi:hypothetical protein